MMSVILFNWHKLVHSCQYIDSVLASTISVTMFVVKYIYIFILINDLHQSTPLRALKCFCPACHSIVCIFNITRRPVRLHLITGTAPRILTGFLAKISILPKTFHNSALTNISHVCLLICMQFSRRRIKNSISL
jgi:hypothetical protein